MVVKHIHTLGEIVELFLQQEFDEKIQRNRSSLLYRGMPNSAYALATSLQRNCKNKQYELEKSILRNFSKYAAIEDTELKASIWRQLIIGQHHGLPTRLLDWTYSPLSALHFATSGEDLNYMDKHDSVLWSIDINEINSMLPREYREKLSNENAYLFTIDMMEDLKKNLGNYDDDMNGKSMILIEPPSIDQRIINQYSYFSVIPKGIEDIADFLEKNTAKTTKYIIDKSIKWKIRDMLDQMNMNERIVYPGLDGLSAWIKRHYYVK